MSERRLYCWIIQSRLFLNTRKTILKKVQSVGFRYRINKPIKPLINTYWFANKYEVPEHRKLEVPSQQSACATQGFTFFSNAWLNIDICPLMFIFTISQQWRFISQVFELWLLWFICSCFVINLMELFDCLTALSHVKLSVTSAACRFWTRKQFIAFCVDEGG